MPDWYATALAVGVVPALAAIGVLAAVACAVRGDWRTGVGLGLDLWLAAGLLTLATVDTWIPVATVIVIVVVRQVATRVIDRSARLRA